MNISFDQLNDMTYPGRFLIIASSDDAIYAVYGVTARSAASRAKRYVYHLSDRLITVESTDLAVMAQGNLDLLQYNAAFLFPNGLIIGNGQQTDLIEELHGYNAAEVLEKNLRAISYEPDKYQTPRITGCIYGNTAALHIVRAAGDLSVQRSLYPLLLEPGKGHFICTYAGPNIRPTPSYQGAPVAFDCMFRSARHAAEEIYDTFAPKDGEEDLRVSVVAVELKNHGTEKDVCVLNSVDFV